MSVFDVPKCETRACLYWQVGDGCVLTGAIIAHRAGSAHANMFYIHDSNICQVRDQINKYRLETMLER